MFSALSLMCLTFPGKLILFVVWPGCYRRTFLQKEISIKKGYTDKAFSFKQDSERNYLVHLVCIDQVFQQYTRS